MATTTTHNTYGADVSVNVRRTSASKINARYGLAYPLIGSFKKVTGVPLDLQNNLDEGGYFHKSYGIELIRNNLRQLLLCDKGERVMLPHYGISLNKYLFEPLDETTYFLIRRDILRTLKKYFSLVRVISLRVFSESKDAEQGKIIISLTLQLLDESLNIFDAEVTIA